MSNYKLCKVLQQRVIEIHYLHAPRQHLVHPEDPPSTPIGFTGVLAPFQNLTWRKTHGNFDESEKTAGWCVTMFSKLLFLEIKDSREMAPRLLQSPGEGNGREQGMGVRGLGCLPPQLLSELPCFYLLKNSPAKARKTFQIHCCSPNISVLGTRQFWIPNSTIALEQSVLNPLSLPLIIYKTAL